MTDRRQLRKDIEAMEESVGTHPELEVVIRNWLVMSREQAEKEGRTILGESSEAAESGYVRVPAETEEFRI